MDSLAFLVSVGAIVVAVIAISRVAKVDKALALLRRDFERLSQPRAVAEVVAPVLDEPAVVEIPVDIPAAAAAVTEAPTSKAWGTPAQPVDAGPEEAIPEPAELDPVPKPVRKPLRDMEQAIAARWFVWIGGAAIAIGGLLFVKYAYDHHLISPALQIVLGLMAGAALVAAGEYVRRMTVKPVQADYVPAALSSAGIATAFGSLYAAYALYGLIGPTVAFAGLGAVAVGALALSRLQGPLIAALGLIGSYGTPALVSAPEPSATGLFLYLLVILAASFATLRGRDWWWLAYSAIAGSGLWSALWLIGPYTTGDSLIVGLFAHAVGLVSFFGIKGRAALAGDGGQSETVGLVGLAVEVLLLAALAVAAHHSEPALILFFLGLATLMAIGWVQPRLTYLAPAAALAGTLVLLPWADVSVLQEVMDEQGQWSWTVVLGAEGPRYVWISILFAALAGLVGCAGTRLSPRPMEWSIATVIAAVLPLVAAWGRAFDYLSDPAWAALAGAFALALLATAYLGRGRHDDEPQQLASGIVSVGAAVLVYFLLDRLFDRVWLTLALAAAAVVFAVLAGWMRVKLQAMIAGAFGALVTLRLFVSRELWQDDRALPLGAHWVIYGYGVPAVLFIAGSRILRAAGYLRSAMTLEGLSLGLVVSLISLEIRVLIGGGVTEPRFELLEMSAHILTWLGAAYGLLYRQRVYSSFIASWGARLLLAGSLAAMVGLSLLALNPVVSGRDLQGGAIFNALLLAYLAPAALVILIARHLPAIGLARAKPFAETLAVGLLAVYLSLELKRLYQGVNLDLPAQDELEAALHVLLWLGLAIAMTLRPRVIGREAAVWSGRDLQPSRSPESLAEAS